MGTVHAKEGAIPSHLPKPDINYDDCQETKQLPLAVPARVDRIHIEGLVRTKNDIVESVVKEIFTAKTFEDVLFKTHKARMKLDQLNLFRNIAVHIDVSKGRKATPDGLEVTFQVKELRRIVGGVTTEIGNNNEGSLVVGLKAPNMAGRGERIQADYSYGSKRTNNFNIAFVKPLLGVRNPMITTSIYQRHSEWPTSGFKLRERGLILDFGLNSFPLVKHNFQYDASVRDLGVFSRSSSFDVREESGTSLRSAVRHILSTDLRDEQIFPSCGSLFQLTTEFAGLGGNVGFVKNEVYFQTNYSLIEDIVFQSTLAGGIMNSISDDKKINVCDMFHLGGPLSLRGFKARGIGPKAGEDALGSLCYFSGGLHLYTPLPFRPGRGGFGELFRTHVFVNYGNVADTSKDEPLLDQLKQNMRVASGLGVAIRLGQMARIEVNYCFPLRHEQEDKTQPGVQFGIGVQFI